MLAQTRAARHRLPFPIHIPHSALRIPHSLALSAAGAVVGVVCLAVAFTLEPGVRLEFDRDLPRMTSGFYPAEIVGDDSFAWTGRSAVVRLPGADRRRPWTCAVRVRGGRSAPLAQPTVDVAADGLTLGSLQLTNDYQTIEVSIPPLPSRSGLVVTIASSTAFVPGPGDRRELGVQVDRVECRRAGGFVVPPERALTSAAVSAAAFGAGFALLGTPLGTGLLATTSLAAAQAVPLSDGVAPYSAYGGRAGPLGIWIVLVVVAIRFAGDRWRRPISPAARFVLAFSSSALFLELLALLHPSKLVVDAVFHAHRFEWVLGGRYFFTQPMPDGVQFPYAIALYLFAIPWSVLTDDHVTLLRVIVCAAHALAGAVLYAAVVRAWQDRVAGAVAVVLFHLVPLPFIVIGNANLTYAFGQSAAFVTIAAAATWVLQRRRWDQVVALTVLAALAFLSHVGVFPVLLTVLMTSAVLYWLLGEPTLRLPARNVLIAAVVAAVLSVVSYYGRFGEVYKSLDRVRGASTAEATAGAALGTTDAATKNTVPLRRRAATVVMLALRAFGWPILLLGAAGLWDVAATRGRDRLTLMLAGLALTYAIFVGFAAMTPVEPRFQKYSDEFIDRVNYATIPLAVILAGRAASRAWTLGAGGRVAAGAALAAAAVLGVRQWLGWLA